jgi:hypothetical protein
LPLHSSGTGGAFWETKTIFEILYQNTLENAKKENKNYKPIFQFFGINFDDFY